MTEQERNAPTLPPPAFPNCHCAEPTPWDERINDGPWPDMPKTEQRTCPKCGASLTVELP